MAIDIIGKLKAKNGGAFKLMDSADVSYDGSEEISVKMILDSLLEGGSIYEVENQELIPTLEKAKAISFCYVKQDVSGNAGVYIIEEVDENGHPVKYTNMSDILTQQIPKLEYVDAMPEGTILYKNEKDDIILQFKFSSATFGNANYKIYKDGALIRSWSDAKGNVMVNLGPIGLEGTYNFTVTATDYLGIPAPETLSVKVICGGLKLTSTFQQTIDGDVFETSSEIDVPYAISCSDRNASVKLLCKIENESGVVKEELLQMSTYAENGMWHAGTMDAISQPRGLYKVTLQGYTGASLEDTTLGTFISDKVEFTFMVLNTGEIGIISEFDTSTLTTDSYVTVPFKISTKVANYLMMRGVCEQETEIGTWVKYKETPEAGVSCTMNITAYWSIGMLPEGRYRIVMTGYTLDGGQQSLENAVLEFDITQAQYTKVNPITSNLLCWFDANSKRNFDADPDIWYNSTTLGDTYRILLHDLNYSTNGWRPVDENASETDNVEYMLKFTGDSYGELVKVNADGSTTQYNPFNIFSNAGLEGITIETTFRTRCIGEMLAKVITCQEGTSTNTPGLSITYNKMFLASDSQTADLQFAEEEWVHVAFVVDKNIRTLEELGQDNIENVNPVGTMRIYINGCLCLAIPLTNDKFLDAAGRSFPLILNGNWRAGQPCNFGECEIKFLRIYNSYLTSSDILNNYIASIYDLNEQQALKDKNDLSKQKIPTVTFKRKKTAANQTTFKTLHALTEKKYQKKTFVDCVMEFNDGEGNITVYDNVDVLTQGTSSLAYPVKNYQIKCYSDMEHKKKQKIIPSVKKDDPRWHGDYSYTFKCDYMDSSHRNNTPSATFYDQVWEFLGANSPARANGYLDAIDGFPIIVYYTDDYENEGLTLAGTFMWNTDKGGSDLGFEPKDAEGNDVLDENGNPYTCVSYEGTANASNTSGCFYKFDESIKHVYKYQVEDWHKEYKAANPDYQGEIEDFQALIDANLVDYDTFEEFLQTYDEYDYVGDDWDPRFAYNEDDDAAMYGPMLALINWVSDAEKNGTFKEEFEEHFDMNYAMAFGLHLMMFMSVDNCGFWLQYKNRF